MEPQEIAGEGIVCLSPRFGKGYYKDFMAAFARDGITPRIVREADSFDELLFAVSLGEGISIVSKNVAGQEVKAVALKHSHHASNYVIAYRKGERRLEVMALVAAARDYFRKQRFLEVETQ